MPSLVEFPRTSRSLRTRFAPSPTGFLHLGHVASAIYVWGLGRKLGAEIVLRLEDHDQGRSRPEYEKSILEDLEWLGFQADIGVTSAGGPSRFRQSDHPERYEQAIAILGDRVYRCNCSRKDIQARTPGVHEELRYDGRCRTLDAGPNVRAIMDSAEESFYDGCVGYQKQNPALQCGDLLLKDRDGFWTYNFAVIVDDIAEDVNLIIRGQDILGATGRQLQLRRRLAPEADEPKFYHHPLIWEDATRKLSKRDRSTSLAQWRAQGFSAAEIIGKAAHAVGLLPHEQPLHAKNVPELFHERD